MADRVTDKKLKNRRYRSTETRILITLLMIKDSLSLERLIRMAKISRSTLSRHHKNLHEIAPDYRKYVLKKCQNITRSLLKNPNSELRTVYRRILVFMSANRLIMEFILEYGEQSVFEDIIYTIKPKILASSKITDEEMFMIYTKEVAGLIEEWGKQGYDKESIVSIINKILSLTETAHIRLNSLKSFN